MSLARVQTFLRLTVPGYANYLSIISSFSARYRPLSSYRWQHPDVTISAERVRRTAESGRDSGWHWTVTTEGQHWVEDATKNNVHYSFRMKFI